jgi:hypothetical protein
LTWSVHCHIIDRTHFIHHRYLTRQESVLRDAAANGKETIVRFVGEYIVKPIRSIYHTVRYDSKEFAIQSAESLNTDIQSLVRRYVLS